MRIQEPTAPISLSPQRKRLSPHAFLLLAGLSLFFVLFLWRFFDASTSALGINMTVFLGLLLLLFRQIAKERGVYSPAVARWMIPLGLMALSYALFENPYVRAVNIFVFFFVGLLFAAHTTYGAGSEKRWSAPYLVLLLLTYFETIPRLFRPFRLPALFRQTTRKASSETIARALLGIVIFGVVAGFVIIPLLSSADSEFGVLLSSIQDFFAWLMGLIPDALIPRIIVFCILFSFFGALGLLWLEAKPVTLKESEEKIDSLVVGIVLGGIFLLYVLFIGLQIKHLWGSVLPIQFSETEHLVKSGFWQLFVLTLLNIFFFIKLQYRHIYPTVRWILNGFVVSSLLLVASAAQRMFLYAYYYGLSYEKFFASYTVVFCIGVFVWFLWVILSHKRTDILKGLVHVSLWAYTLATVLPLEQIILRANISWERGVDSRIDLNEMRMLSPDVLGYISAHFNSLTERSQGSLDASLRERSVNNFSSIVSQDDDADEKSKPTASGLWDNWIAEQCRDVRKKAWYEMSLSAASNYDAAKKGPHGCYKLDAGAYLP